MVGFTSILNETEDPAVASMLLILAWVASCDDVIHELELEGLREVARTGKAESDLPSVIEIAKAGCVDEIEIACKILKELDRERRLLMLKLAVGMALADGRLTTTEGHVVRFIADVLTIGPSKLDNVFRELTGKPLPIPADPSSVEWWNKRDSSAASTDSNTKTRTEYAKAEGSKIPPHANPGVSMNRFRDLAILGLDEDATHEEIKQGYRRMAKVHHPDRYVSLGPEAVKAAEISFQRIRASYDRLVDS